MYAKISEYLISCVYSLLHGYYAKLVLSRQKIMGLVKLAGYLLLVSLPFFVTT